MFFDLTIVGAGVVGLSIARSCTELGMTVVVLEKHSRAGEGISSRNSGVIHAGIYYPNESLKTKFCLTGNKLLYDYAEAKNIADRTWEASHPDQLVSNNGWLWGGEKYASAVDSKMGFWEPSNYNKYHPEHVGNPEVTWNKEGRGGTTKLYKNIKTRTKGWFENNKNVGNSIWGWGGRMRKTKNKKVKKK